VSCRRACRARQRVAWRGGTFSAHCTQRSERARNPHWLNLVLNQPRFFFVFCCRYTEAVEDKGRPDAVVAAEAAATYKLRNDSCITDLCSGMFRSTVICPDCGKVSKTFDPCVEGYDYPNPPRISSTVAFISDVSVS